MDDKQLKAILSTTSMEINAMSKRRLFNFFKDIFPNKGDYKDINDMLNKEGMETLSMAINSKGGN
eukprot:3177808-Ditylum_brightwellii.AAC.1